MESTRPPSSGLPAPRRIFTAPVTAPQPAPSSQSAGGLVDTLYDHPNVKIVSFTAAASRSLSVGPRATSAPDIEPGSLPWSTQLERTIAVGPFRIYRAPGSVAFLSCGSALQPILPKSQVWCVDEESSKFVLQVRRPQYWRIEVPVEEQEDIRRAHRLREVFDAILLFEKTECPFQRSFTVQLPPRPQTPVKKRPWTPVRRSSACLPVTPVTPVEIARLHKGTPRGSICVSDLRAASDARRALSEHARGLKPPVEESGLRQSGQRLTAGQTQIRFTSPFKDREQVEKPQEMGAVPLGRSTTGIPARSRPRESRPGDVPVELPRLKTPAEPLESWRRSAPLPPSPPLSNPGSPLTPSKSHTLPEAPLTQSTSSGEAIGSESFHSCDAATGNFLVSESSSGSPAMAEPTPSSPNSKKPEEVLRKTPSSSPTPSSSSPSSSPPPTTRTTTTANTTRRPPVRRATTSSISPLHPAAGPFSNPQPRHRNPPPPSTNNGTRTSSALTTTAAAATANPARLPPPLMATVLHKTCEILMSPPSHLISLMLRVAARIVAGEWRGLVFGTGEAGERVSVEWDLGDVEEVDRLGRGRRRWGNDGGMARASGNGFGRVEEAGAEVEDWWVRRRRGIGGERMAGSFPESDDEDEEEAEEAVGPLDQSGMGSRSRSPSNVGDGAIGAAAVGAAAAEKENTDGGQKLKTDADKFADAAEWGVD